MGATWLWSSYPTIDGGAVQGADVTKVDITGHEWVEESTGALTQALASVRELSAYRESLHEAERTRIAREIHDELGSLLVALKMDVDWLAKRLADQAELGAKCRGMGRLIDTAVGNLGRIGTDLRPSVLDHQGLWAALEWQAQEFTDAQAEGRGLEADIQFHIAADVQVPAGAQGERWAIAVFRIFQAMLGNVARHARAQHVRIRLYVDGPPQPVLHLEVRDDGVGAEREVIESPRSYGLTGMRERAAHFGGSLTIDSVPNHGTVVRLVMPFPTPAADAEAPP